MLFCWTKAKTLIKTKRNRKWKIPPTLLERWTLWFGSYKNRWLKVKLLGAGTREKKGAFLVPFVLSEGNSFNICALSQCIVYWIMFRNIPTFTYQKTLFHTLFCLFLKSLKAFSASSITFIRFQKISDSKKVKKQQLAVFKGYN